MKQTVTSQSETPHRSPAAVSVGSRSSTPVFVEFVDNRPEAVAQRRLAEAIHTSPAMVAQRHQLRGMFGETAQLMDGPEEELLRGKLTPVQRAGSESDPAPRKNHTGLPDHLKSGIESLSGIAMDDVRVHYNSAHPAQLNALAYTQGTDIHVAPGQEKHLPHEAWHVVQQAQGRVQPTMQLKDGVPVNDDQGLEHEADAMGGKAMHVQQTQGTPVHGGPTPPTAVHHAALSAPQDLEEVYEGVAQPLVDPQTLSITFPMDADGDGEEEKKRLFFRGSGPSAILMINPDPQPLDVFLGKHSDYKDLQVTTLVGNIYALMQTSGGISQANGFQIAQYMRRLAALLVNSRAALTKSPKHKIQKPPTVATWTTRLLRFAPQGKAPITETVTDKLTVSPLSIVPPATGEYGTKVQNSATPYMQELRKWASYIRGHMLNSKIHGPGTDNNLVPISSTFNKDMEGGIEKKMKDAVISRNKVVSYEIEPKNWGGYTGSGQAPSPSAEQQLPADFKITMKLMKLKQPGADGTDPNNWEINPNKPALFDRTESHRDPGTTNYNPNAIPEAVAPGVYEEVNGGRWWPNQSQTDVWTVDGEVAVQDYSGQDRGIASWSKSDKPKNIEAKNYFGQPAKLELINNRLVVTIPAAAVQHISNRENQIKSQLTMLGKAVTRVEEQWKQAVNTQNQIWQDIEKLIEHNKGRSAQYYGQALEQVQRYAEAERPIVDAHRRRVYRLEEIEKIMTQLRKEIDGKQTDEEQFWLKQKTLAKSDEPKFWSEHATRETHSDDYEAWYRSSTGNRQEMEWHLRDMASDQKNVPGELSRLNRTLDEQHCETLGQYARAIAEAKAAKAKELEYQAKVAKMLTPAMRPGLQGGQVKPMVSADKMEIEPKPQIPRLDAPIGQPPLTQFDILQMAREVLKDLVQGNMSEGDKPQVFSDYVEQEYIQKDLARQFSQNGSWPAQHRSQIQDMISKVIAGEMERYIMEMISHLGEEKSVSSRSITHETASNPFSLSNSSLFDAPSTPNFGINLPSFGTPNLPVINLNQPEQSMEISQDQPRRLGRPPKLREKVSTSLDRDAVLKKAINCAKNKRRGVPEGHQNDYDDAIKDYVENDLKKALRRNETWEMTEEKRVMMPIRIQIKKIAKHFGYYKG